MGGGGAGSLGADRGLRPRGRRRVGERGDLPFFRLACGGDKPAGSANVTTSGAEGSRAGWWILAVHDIATKYTGGDIERALWSFSLNHYYTLQPGAMEAAGLLPEDDHFAVKEGLAAGSAWKKRERARLEATKNKAP